MKKRIALLLAMVLLAGCGAAPAGDTESATGETVSQSAGVDVNALYSQLEAAGLPEMLEMNEDMRLNIYGIAAEDVKQVKVTVCSEGLRADEVWLIEAVDEAAAQTIKTLAEGRIKQKDAESVTYSPEQNVIVKRSYLAVEGNFVIFLCSPDVEAMTAIVNAAFGK